MPDYPLVSIVTPVYQMARFVGDTLNSVLAQDYANIEYIVMDGGSTDGTLEIIEHCKRLRRANVALRCFSEPDHGTADAVNKGFARSNGSIFAYLHADDTYAPGAVSTAVTALLENPSAQGVYGEAQWVTQDGSLIGRYPTRSFDPHLLRSECFICQPASFVRREVFESIGMLDSSLDFAYDYDFWIRLSKSHQLRKIDEFLATSRMHDGSKTFKYRREVLRESIAILQRQCGYVPFARILAYTGHLLDRRDQFFSPFRPSVAKYLLSLLIGWRFNWRRPGRYTNEWASVMSLECLFRRLKLSA